MWCELLAFNWIKEEIQRLIVKEKNLIQIVSSQANNSWSQTGTKNKGWIFIGEG